MTNSRVGSQTQKISKKPCTRAGDIISESANQKPNIPQAVTESTGEINFCIRVYDE